MWIETNVCECTSAYDEQLEHLQSFKGAKPLLLLLHIAWECLSKLSHVALVYSSWNSW